MEPQNGYIHFKFTQAVYHFITGSSIAEFFSDPIFQYMYHVCIPKTHHPKIRIFSSCPCSFQQFPNNVLLVFVFTKYTDKSRTILERLSMAY